MNFKNWDEYKLGDICTKIGSGATPSGGGNAYKNIGISLIRSQNVRDFSFSNEGLAFIDDGQADKLKGVTVKAGDVLLNITGDSVARSCIVTDEVLPARVNQHVSIIRVNEKVAHNKFVFYFTQFIKPQLLSLAGNGATRNALTKAMIEQLDIFLPPLSEQRAVAATISALDDKIEINNRINKTLEEMAQALFTRWFVDFEFPDENGQPYKSSGGEMEESELGPIPKGWKLARLSDICNVLSGGTPKTGVAEYWNGPIPFFSPKDASDGFYTIDTEKTITGEGLKNCNSKLYPKDTVFITARGTVGKVVLSGRDMAMNQSCYALQGREEIGQYFLFFQTVRAAEQLRKSASGAVFDAIIVKSFDSIKVVVPPTCFLESFCELVHSLLSNVCLNTEQNNYLSSLRDAILPQLMSGEIRVPIEEVAADV